MSMWRPVQAPALISKQFNSPVKLYSPENVQEALNKQTQVLANGAIGIDFHHLAAPNLANSAVLKMLEEEERQRGGKGLKRVAWPPPPEQSEHITEQPVYRKVPVNTDQPDSNHPEEQSWENTFDQVPQQQSNQFYPPSQQQQVYPTYQPPPATVVLRPIAPVSQAPPPVYESQPAATKGAEGQKMRGDEKWPPTAYKQQAEAENEARRSLAKGPAFRPKKVKKDYSGFFAQNALTPNYPTYRAPPGTQHYIEEGTSTF